MTSMTQRHWLRSKGPVLKARYHTTHNNKDKETRASLVARDISPKTGRSLKKLIWHLKPPP